MQHTKSTNTKKRKKAEKKKMETLQKRKKNGNIGSKLKVRTEYVRNKKKMGQI